MIQGWWEQAPLGWKFVPTDAELLWGYLYPEVGRGVRRGHGPIKFSDQVYKTPPWEFCTDSTALPGESGDKKHYFFTELKSKDQKRIDRTVSSHGTWEGSQKKKILWKNNYTNNNNNSSGIMGFKRLFNFTEKSEGKEMNKTDWIMHEFKLPDEEINLVLCVIQKKKR